MKVKALSDSERDAYLRTVNRRCDDFLLAAERFDADPELLSDLREWVEIVRRDVTNAFSAWYDEEVRGRRVPLEVRLPSPADTREPKGLAALFEDAACEICGDRRVLNVAHIIDRRLGGPDEAWNLMRLCANHHFLFDHGGLTEHEFQSIDWDAKDERARRFVLEGTVPDELSRQEGHS